MPRVHTTSAWSAMDVESGAPVSQYKVVSRPITMQIEYFRPFKIYFLNSALPANKGKPEEGD